MGMEVNQRPEEPQKQPGFKQFLEQVVQEYKREKTERLTKPVVKGLHSGQIALSQWQAQDAERNENFGLAKEHYQSLLPLQKPGKERAETYLAMGRCEHGRKFEGVARIHYEQALDEIANDKSLSESERHRLNATCYSGLAGTYGPNAPGEAPLSPDNLKRQEYLGKAVAELDKVKFDGSQTKQQVTDAWKIYDEYIKLQQLMQPFQSEGPKVDLDKMKERCAMILRSNQ
jgi:hypothetical protein